MDRPRGVNRQRRGWVLRRGPSWSGAGWHCQKVCVLGLVSLIELKLAARRLKDFADVLELIRLNGLDEGYPSVRPNYIECLEEKRREDCYAIRRGELDAGPEGK